MTDRPLLFAFIGHDLAAARIDIACDHKPLSTKGLDRGTFMYEGRETPFRIVTQPEQLRGLELCGYAFVRSASRIRPSKYLALDEMARAMLRHPHKNNCNKPLAMPD